MNLKHKKLLAKARDAISDLHSDTSVSPEQTKESLEDIQATISLLISGIEEDLKGR